MPNPEYKVPAELLNPIKEALIKIGYANANTPLSFVQDAYYKYIMIRQTGFNPHIPYALGLLPKELQDQIGGGGTDPEVPVAPATPTLIELVAQGSMIIAKVKVVYTDPLAKPASMNVRVFNGDETFNSFSDSIENPVSDTVYELTVVTVPTGSYSAYANASSQDGESSVQSQTKPVVITDFTPQPFELLDIDKDGFVVSPIPKGGAYWSTSTGQTGSIEYSDGTGSGVFNPPLNTNTWLNIETFDGTHKQQVQFLVEIAFDTANYTPVDGQLTVTAPSSREISSSAVAKYTLGGTPKSVPLVVAVDKKSATATLDLNIPNDTIITIEDPVNKLKTNLTVFG